MHRQANFLRTCAPSLLLVAYACASCTPESPDQPHQPNPDSTDGHRVRVISAHATLQTADQSPFPVEWTPEEAARLFTSNLARPVWDLQDSSASIPVHLQLSVTLVPPDAHHDQAIVHLEASVVSAGSAETAAGVASDVNVDIVFPAQQWSQEPENVLRRSFARVAETLTACTELQLGDDNGLIHALSSSDPAVAQCAVVEASDRRVPLPSSLLLPHLQQTELDALALAVIGHAAITGQADLATAILERIPARDPQFLVAALPALARVDSDEVRGFIRAVAEAHPNENVRSFAASWIGP